MTELHTRDIPAPKYKVLDSNIEEDGTRKVYHVKLGQPHIARMITPGKNSFVEVEYVHVIAVRKAVEDKSGSFVYNETSVTASDEEGNAHTAYLYFTHRALELDEVLFALGEV